MPVSLLAARFRMSIEHLISHPATDTMGKLVKMVGQVQMVVPASSTNQTTAPMTKSVEGQCRHKAWTGTLHAPYVGIFRSEYSVSYWMRNFRDKSDGQRWKATFTCTKVHECIQGSR